MMNFITDSKMINGFLPIINTNTTRIVLGTMPSVNSLLQMEYYGNPRNQFWKILFSIFEEGRAPVDYQDKLAALHRHGIGLWDVLSNCDRVGSLDSNIKNEEYTDIPTLLKEYPNVKMLIFNGKKSYQFFKKAHREPLDVTCVVMPSTSPANAMMNLECKCKEWKEVLLLPL